MLHRLLLVITWAVVATVAPAAGIVSGQVAALTNGVLNAMFLSKVKFATLMVLVLGLLAAGGPSVTGLRSHSAAQAQTIEEPQPADLQKQIDKLIEQLGSDEFAEREKATKDLEKLGKAAVPALEKATKSKDAEISRRAQALVNTLNPPKDSFTILSVNGDMMIPLKGTYKQILIADVNGNAKIEAVEIDAEEVWIGAVNGSAKVNFKGKAKKLRIGAINGDCQIDFSEFSAGEVEIGAVNGSAKIQLLSTGKIHFTGDLNGSATTTAKAQGEIHFAKIIQGGSTVELSTRGNVLLDDRLDGSARLKVNLAKDFTVQGQVGEHASVDASYYGKAKCLGAPKSKIRLNKVEAPK